VKTSKGLRPARTQDGKPVLVNEGPLTGSLTVEGFQLSGDGLSTPIQVPKVVLEPVVIGSVVQGRKPDRTLPSTQTPALAATLEIPLAGAHRSQSQLC